MTMGLEYMTYQERLRESDFKSGEDQKSQLQCYRQKGKTLFKPFAEETVSTYL